MPAVGRAILILLLLAIQPSHAENPPLPSPAGKVVLTISGQISNKNHDNDAVFDMNMLAALPQHTISTRTPWLPGVSRFTGPYLQDVLNLVGAKGRMLKAIALNDYKTDIPLDDVARYQVVLARLLNGKPMPVRDKGPLFIVYPYDSQPALRSEIYYGRSAWQLKSLQVE
ncbi:molybdopterin-dependent oxidoreductase [Chromobacterium piscinae]|uniref:Molybdopterin-dependent oxidoreductase n=1 Tax=Chromobacterium piscinae TaxID=686831 RepID=A0ABV0H2D4_9NEIS|nr:molybdopterin-dependent oxidoreductase [Chromobacterium piscinae]MBX9297770.1 molybdopterin-dependent oxidoreductase [Chromobacterium vaccinii]MBX9347636.1 molybdopterin-dependent oxidoreductase [Chromobacterium vaccinii]MBX9356103.1 molybdopterin-dependent oxidoreductase [Chromobacterium vaccinii]MCD4504111.1 molybdopterin-dependent oxidoreductase [Chromobacterium piscinae]MCD5328234.1 molybdopterin-dependent oxidoreductase [Chromobacterium piscinae]